jgi:hypothetical protein
MRQGKSLRYFRLVHPERPQIYELTRLLPFKTLGVSVEPLSSEVTLRCCKRLIISLRYGKTVKNGGQNRPFKAQYLVRTLPKKGWQRKNPLLSLAAQIV